MVENNKPKANLHKRGIVTLKDWCLRNGYGEVTSECMLSAGQSQDPNVVSLVKKEKIKGIVKNGNK